MVLLLLRIHIFKIKQTKKPNCVTYFYNTTKFHITDGQLLMGFFGNNLLEYFLQALTNFPLNKGCGSYQKTIDLYYKM